MKDKAMIEACDAGLAVWDGQSRGTQANINALRNSGKPVYVYRTDIEAWEE